MKKIAWFFDGAWFALHAVILVGVSIVAWNNGPWGDTPNGPLAALALVISAAQCHSLYEGARKYLA